MIKDLNCRCAMPEIAYETDDIENYKGKWTVLCTLDNGGSFIGSKTNFENTEQAILDGIDDMQKYTEYANKHNNSYVTNHIKGTSEYGACMFNSSFYKSFARQDGHPIITSMIPIPVGE